MSDLFAPKFREIEYEGETIQLKNLTARQAKQFDKIEDPIERMEQYFLHRVYKDDKPVFRSLDDINDISDEAWAYLSCVVAKDVKKNLVRMNSLTTTSPGDSATKAPEECTTT